MFDEPHPAANAALPVVPGDLQEDDVVIVICRFRRRRVTGGDMPVEEPGRGRLVLATVVVGRAALSRGRSARRADRRRADDP